jgi:hypothetical protein
VNGRVTGEQRALDELVALSEELRLYPWQTEPRAARRPPWDEPHRYRTMAQVIAEEQGK